MIVRPHFLNILMDLLHVIVNLYFVEFFIYCVSLEMKICHTILSNSSLLIYDAFTCMHLPRCCNLNSSLIMLHFLWTAAAGSSNSDLASLFECPVCFDYALPPITQCQSGHIVCQACKQKLNMCPTCRGPLGEWEISCKKRNYGRAFIAAVKFNVKNSMFIEYFTMTWREKTCQKGILKISTSVIDLSVRNRKITKNVY